VTSEFSESSDNESNGTMPSTAELMGSLVPFTRRLGKATECLEEGLKAWDSGLGGP
jgi:hypothetical protein